MLTHTQRDMLCTGPTERHRERAMLCAGPTESLLSTGQGKLSPAVIYCLVRGGVYSVLCAGPTGSAVYLLGGAS